VRANRIERFFALALIEVHRRTRVPGLGIVGFEANGLVEQFQRTIEIVNAASLYGLLHQFIDMFIARFKPGLPYPVLKLASSHLIRRIL